MINDELLEFSNSKKVMNVMFISNWLKENEGNFNFQVNESSCRKWSEWKRDKNVHIYPCVCPFREDNCIFIETYYELQKVVKLHKKEEYFNSLVLEFSLIVGNKDEVLDWFKKHINIASDSVFVPEITIMLNSEPYKILKIKLNENEFKSIIELQKIFNEIEYNQKY